MKINKISWENYRGLADNSISANSNDVIITGQNGSGKSSIASILPFVLFGKGALTVKQFDDGLITADDGGIIHAATIEFDNGLTLRREYFWTSGGNRHAHYVNGKPVKKGDFDATVYDITRGGKDLVFNPFAFCELDSKDRRKFLLNIFDANVEVNDPQFSDLPSILNGKSPESFLARATNDIKYKKAAVNDNATRIDENKRNLEKFPSDLDAEYKSVSAKLADARAKQDKLSKDFNYELTLATKQLADFNKSKRNIESQIRTLKETRERLLKEHRKASQGICPTCHQHLPAQLELAAKIVIDGKHVAHDIKDFESQLADVINDISDAQKRINDINRNLQTQGNLFGTERDQLKQTVDELTKRQSTLQTALNARDRINELVAENQSLCEQIQLLEQQKKLVGDFLQRKAELMENRITEHFEHVRFKLFDITISSGEVKPVCEPTLHGVPYSSLSHGERFKAACDVVKTLQRHFGVELPLFFDDAESYTVNSFVDLPNQIWLFKVTDEPELTINVVERRNAA